jgi:hypothetical protein
VFSALNGPLAGVHVNWVTNGTRCTRAVIAGGGDSEAHGAGHAERGDHGKPTKPREVLFQAACMQRGGLRYQLLWYKKPSTGNHVYHRFQF